MHTQTLKDARFRTIGYIETATNGKQTGKDERFRIVGYYDPCANLTQDARFSHCRARQPAGLAYHLRLSEPSLASNLGDIKWRLIGMTGIVRTIRSMP